MGGIINTLSRMMTLLRMPHQHNQSQSIWHVWAHCGSGCWQLKLHGADTVQVHITAAAYSFAPKHFVHMLPLLTAATAASNRGFEAAPPLLQAHRKDNSIAAGACMLCQD